jgi:putative ABC transport system permease protein
MRSVLADLRYAFRVMSRTPSFALAVVTVLALGVGANTTMFSIVNAVLLRPLPFDEPERLVRIFTRTPGGRLFELSPGKFYGWQRDARSFEGMAMYQCCGFRELALSGTGAARTVRATAVSAGFFEIVRARPALGRVFRPDEDTPGGKYVVVLSDRFWRAELGGSPDVIGRAVKLNDERYTIVGVMPAAASVASWTGMASDVWIPLALTDEQRSVRGGHNRDGVARLKRDVELAQAQAEMDAISARLAREFPETDGRGWGAVVVPMQEEIVGDRRAMLLMLLAAVGLVLLIACANVGNLLLTRALSRRREIAIRSALGAGRGRVFQQLLTEALLLAGAGGALGVLLAYGALRSASTLLATQVPRAEEISLDGSVLLFAVGVSMFTGMLAGTLPAVRGGRSALGTLDGALKEGGRSNAAIGNGTRRLLIVGEVALSLMLLMGAGVMIQSLLALRHGETGFDPDDVLTMRVRLVDARYRSPAQRSSFFDAALQRIRALPGVQAAGTINDLPFASGESQTLALEGYPPQREAVAIQVRQVTPGYLRAMGIPVLRGRDVVDGDAEVLLVSQAAARLYWGEDDPVGRRAALPFSKTVLREVVGIVGDVKQRSLAEETTPTAYYYTRQPTGRATFVVRTSVPPATLAQPLVGALRAIDPEQPVIDVRTMVQVLEGELASQRFSTLVLGVFAGIALLLAAVGIYSVVSFIARGRNREIGIRTALGAQRRDILRLVIVEGMTPAVAGIAVGTIAALASARVMETLVFGVSASDPLTLASAGIALALVALIASLVPAYRALRVDPVNVLRAE